MTTATTRQVTARLIAASLSLGLVCGMGAVAGAAGRGVVRDERSVSRRLQFSGTGVRTVDARTISGSIRVTGDGGADVRLDATTKIEAETDDALRSAQQEVVVDAQERGSTVEIAVHDAGRPTCGESGNYRSPAWWDRKRYEASVTLTIRVPRDVRVRLCTVNGGEITVTGTQGDFDVSNVNGRVALSDVRGSGRAVTVNGGIEASFVEAPRAESQFKTVNGDIAVTLPRNLSADLRLKTFNGDLYTDFDTVTLPATPERTRRPDLPRLVYRPRGFTNVRIGGGGPELTFDTLNGDVRILRASR
jgi:hypothetical protein